MYLNKLKILIYFKCFAIGKQIKINAHYSYMKLIKLIRDGRNKIMTVRISSIKYKSTQNSRLT